MKRKFDEMKRKFDESPLTSGYLVLVSACIGYLFSFLACFFNARKKNKVDEAEAVPAEPAEEEAQTETENPTEE